MAETGKRRHNHSIDNNNENNMNRKRRLSYDTKDGIIVVYRILCPSGVIGSIICKHGTVINVIKEETRARIKVLDPFPGCTERVITIYCSVKKKKDVVESSYNTEKMTPLCSAQDALLRVHHEIVTSLATAAESVKIDRDDIRECRLLVPSTQCSRVIGKAGSTIKEIKSRTRANVKIVSKDVLDSSHTCAMDFDSIVLISGDPESVKKALFAVSAIMYRFSPLEQIPLDASVQEVPAIIMPSDLSIYPQDVPSFIGTLPQGYGENAVNPIPVHHGFSGSSRSKELVIKLICSSSKIDRVIGKGGSTIKGIKQASGSHIEVNEKLDNYCVITVTSKEFLDDSKSKAVEAVLLLQEKINDGEKGKVKMELLVPCKVIGCIIGKSGSIISEIRKTTNAYVYILKGNNKPKCADPNDELLVIRSEVRNVRDALIQIVLRLRDDVLRDRGCDLTLPPSFMSYVPQVSQAANNSSYSYNRYGRLPQFTTTEIRIPENAVDKVMGKGGSNLDNIRRISGAMIEISDSKTSHGDFIALISGTPEEKRSAENLLEAFIMST